MLFYHGFYKADHPITFPFNVKRFRKTDADDETPLLTIDDFMTMLTVGKPSVLEKALFLCKFHRGLDATTLADRFNFQAFAQIAEWFGNENPDSWDLQKCPVPIILVRPKTDIQHYGCIDHDCVIALQKYLKKREQKEGQPIKKGQPIFLNNHGNPVSPTWIARQFFKLADVAEIQEKLQTHSKQYSKRSHLVRDLLETTLTDCGVPDSVAEIFIGHKPISKYNQKTKLYPDKLRTEYCKASKRLNIFTKFSNVVSGNDDSDELRLDLKEKISEVDKLKEEMITERAIKKQEEMLLQQQSEIMTDMQRQIDELKSNSTKSIPKKTEFCCIGCSTVHDKAACPACGAKLKRIYEEKSVIN